MIQDRGTSRHSKEIKYPLPNSPMNNLKQKLDYGLIDQKQKQSRNHKKYSHQKNLYKQFHTVMLQ